MAARRGRGSRPGVRRPGPGLGLERRIPRRDFLQGALLGAASTVGGALLGGIAAADAADAAQPGYYPPALQGLRGAHPGSFEAAHALRDGRPQAAARDTGESYDLVVVGAGISGLAAAYFYQAATARGSRILILDNHDDFGGHAKRNEFVLDGQLQLVNGGTLDIDSPRPYSAVARGLLRALGIDVPALSRAIEHRQYYAHRGLHGGVFFDAETFGADQLIAGWRSVPMHKLLQNAPLSPQAREDLARLEEAPVDYLPGLTEAQK
jgi:spermidine dehydrogenase